MIAFAASPAAAEPLCAEIADAMATAEAGDSKAGLYEASSPATSAKPECVISIALGGARSTTCRWAFPYRAEEASEAFAELLRKAQACAVPAASAVEDAGVNHPDSYDLRILPVADGEIGLSLKDKAALGATFVFLRATPKR